MFEEILVLLDRAFNRAGIPYMVIGGQAVLHYGEPRFTKDIDLTVGVAAEELSCVEKAIENLPFKILVADPSPFVKQTMVLPLQHIPSSVRIDVIFSYSPYERNAIARAETVTFAAGSARFARLEDLVIHKVVAGRPRDIEDVRSLMTRNQNLDKIYVREILTQFSQALDEDLVRRFEEAV